MEEANSPNKTNSDEQFANEQSEQGTVVDVGVWLTVKEAAAQIGISERGVQMRAKRGKIRWKLDRDRLLVCLEAPLSNGEQDEQQLSSRTNNEQNSNTVFANTPASDMVVQLRSEVEYLRLELTAQRVTHTEEIARRDTAESEYRRLLLTDRQEIARLRDQLAITAAPTDVPEAFVDAPGEQTGSQSGPADDRAQNSAQQRKTRWWHLWER